MKKSFCNTKLAGAALLTGLMTVAWGGLAVAQDLDDPEAHCRGYRDEAISGFGGYQKEGDYEYAVIPGFTFGCTIQERATGNRVRVKPKFCNVDGGRFPMPSSRDACHRVIDNAINNACKADALVAEPGYEFFSSSEAIERFAGCLPIFREQAKACVAHFKLMRPRCDSGGTVANRPGSGDSTQRTDAPEPSCTGAREGAECWKEAANQPGCYVWDDYLYPGQTVEWSGSCPGGIADGPGTTMWSSDLGPYEYSGTLSDGKLHGHVIVRSPYDGKIEEGPYVNGKKHGRWLTYSRDSFGEHAREDTFVNGDITSSNSELKAIGDRLDICTYRCRELSPTISGGRQARNQAEFDAFIAETEQCGSQCERIYERARVEVLQRIKAELGIN